MKHGDDFRPSVVIYTHRSYPESSGVVTGQQTGLLPRPAGVLDPYRIAAEYPTRWAAYINAHFRSDREVCQTFDVCERTARKWRAGEMGCRAQHQSIALLTHGQAAFDMLVKQAD